MILEETEKRIFDLLQHRNSGDFVPIRQVVMNVLEKIERASKTKGTVTGIATGFIDLDYKTSGFQPSDFILIAARPSMGKTAFVLNIAQYMAFTKDKALAIFSLEMSKEQLVNRMLSMESNVDSQKLRNGNLTDADWDAIVEGIGVIGNSKLIIDDTPGISITELRSKCRKMKLEYGLSMVIIDYLQLMTGSGGKSSENRQQEISEISRSLKALAREINAPVIALSQLSRACETRTDHRPMLSDLRESGAIEQDADVVMFLYRDDYYNKDTDTPNMAEVIIAKQRNGPIGTVNLVWAAGVYQVCQYTAMKQEAGGPCKRREVLERNMESKMKCKMKELCRKITDPEEVTERLCGDGALQDCGLKNLRNHLEAALEAKEKYDALGIPENIYLDTMAVFSRFVGEHPRQFWLLWI